MDRLLKWLNPTSRHPWFGIIASEYIRSLITLLWTMDLNSILDSHGSKHSWSILTPRLPS